MNTSAYNRRNSTVSTVKKSQAAIPLACARRNCRQVSWVGSPAGEARRARNPNEHLDLVRGV